MGRRSGVRLAVAVSALLLVLVTPLPGGAATCSPGDGTTVVVDFGALGGGVETGCASGAGTGFEALSRAGFDVTRVQSNPAFVCRIDGLPGADTEDCTDIPPATGFWSYWTADLGGGWRLATTGAAGPIRGDLEGWAFSTGNTVPPAFAVPAAPATSTSTTSTTTTSTTTTTTTTSSTTSSTTTTTTPPVTTSSPTTTTAPPTSGTGSTTTTSATIPTPTTAAASTSLPDTDGDAAAGEAPPPGSGAGGFVVGATVVGLVAGAGILVARRRAGWM